MAGEKSAGVRFVFCVHNHQPVGNFDHVIEEAYQRAYLPFLEVMERHPAIPWVLHNSGCLWEWLETHQADYIDRIGALATAGRVELLGGGFYEPVLPALSPEDRRGQIERMATYLERRFGRRPDGIWLTERVWEPDLPIDLGDSGVAYLPLDDTQLLQVGVASEQVRGAFLTESGGRRLRVFPALMTLRYRIPYADPEETAEFLCNPFPGGGEGLAVYADDGEKLGSWPGSHRLLYEERWLERFLSALEKREDRVSVTTFAEESRRPAAGLVYLPTGSYAEMGQWTLPPDHQAGYQRAREHLRGAELAAEGELFVRGGFWRNFFARYSESNWMHMRAATASRLCEQIRGRCAPEVWRSARDHLWRAQCNCAYWHGVFGGLYLPHLRDGVYAELVRGEALLAGERHGRGAWVDHGQADFDLDGEPELILENDALVLILAPAQGGVLREWDDRAAAINLVNVLTRRPEFYHREVGKQQSESSGGAATIHACVGARDAGLQKLLLYDEVPRAGLVDRFFAEPPDPDALRTNRLAECGDFRTAPYEHEVITEEHALVARLWRRGRVRCGEQEHTLGLEKRVRLAAGERGYEVRLRYENLSAARLCVWAAFENHVNLLAGQAPDRYVLVDGQRVPPAELGACGLTEEAAEIVLVEEWRGWHIAFHLEPAVRFCRYPVETVSLSETGAERNFQGTALLFCLPLELEAGEARTLTLRAQLRTGVPVPASAPAAGADGS
ncbi:MAG: DUF1926 domain-containing protein [Candidatus Eisenbacteria sp.]|nr:DUF1926 domain-containing protein [Candidatus Eisenbacteria bacterium]